MNSSATTIQSEGIDVEWLQLILAARDLGISIEDIRTFLKAAKDDRDSG